MMRSAIGINSDEEDRQEIVGHKAEEKLCPTRISSSSSSSESTTFAFCLTRSLLPTPQLFLDRAILWDFFSAWATISRTNPYHTTIIPKCLPRRGDGAAEVEEQAEEVLPVPQHLE
jgi:hypothetical protein